MLENKYTWKKHLKSRLIDNLSEANEKTISKSF